MIPHHGTAPHSGDRGSLGPGSPPLSRPPAPAGPAPPMALGAGGAAAAPPGPAPNRPEQGPAPPPRPSVLWPQGRRGPSALHNPRQCPHGGARLPSTSSSTSTECTDALPPFFLAAENKQGKVGRCLTEQDTGQTSCFAVCTTGPVRNGGRLDSR